MIRAQDVLPLVPAGSPGELPSRRDLFLQAMLHLPRLGDADGTISLKTALAEIERLRLRRAADLRPWRHLAVRPPTMPILEQLDVRVVDAGKAEPILSHFHYLRSFRPDGVNVAALWEQRIVALCSLSPLDLPHLTHKLPVASASEAAVVSRIYAFDWAPRNVISYLLARVERSDAVGTGVQVLVTYVNPNMGFTGASFKAANWRLVGFETGTQYAYFRGSYLTDRRLASLGPLERKAVEYSQIPLRPLMVFARFLDAGVSRTASRREVFVIERAPVAAE